MAKLLLTTFVALALATTSALAEDFPSASGIADLGGGNYLLVDDTKDKPELSARPRLRVATLVPGGTVVADVYEDWGSNARPNDLEAVSAVPGLPGHFLVAESGYVGADYGRIFHITVEHDAGGWYSFVVGTAPLPTWLRGQLEAIAIGQKPDGGYTLVLSERGGSGPYTPATLWWGNFNLETGEFTMGEDAAWGLQLQWPGENIDPSARPCTDLWLDGGGYLWASGATDPGDSGPFRSVIYRIGKFDPKQSYPVMYEMDRDMVWYLDGVKVEAIGPAVVAGSILTFCTDDEAFGGIWRPLPMVAPRHQPVMPYYGEYGG